MTFLLLVCSIHLQHQVLCRPFQVDCFMVSLPAKAHFPSSLRAAYLQFFQAFAASIECPTSALCLVTPAKRLKGFKITLTFDQS